MTSFQRVSLVFRACILAEETFQQINRPQVASQRASALRFGDPQVQALWSALLVFTWLPTGFSNRNLREHFASLLGRTLQELGRGQMTYQLPETSPARDHRAHSSVSPLSRHRYRPCSVFYVRIELSVRFRRWIAFWRKTSTQEVYLETAFRRYNHATTDFTLIVSTSYVMRLGWLSDLSEKPILKSARPAPL